MRAKFVAAVLASIVASANGSACAMNSPSAQKTACQVIGGEKLPESSGGAAGLCAAIKEAAQGRFSVEVRVLSEHSLAATVTMANGRSLPEQRLDISDRTLTRKTFEWFAQNLASEAAKANG